VVLKTRRPVGNDIQVEMSDIQSDSLNKYFFAIGGSVNKRVILCLAAALIATLPLLAAELKLGKPVDVKETTKIADLLAKPEQYLGKTVKVEGKIIEVCQMMQCWITVNDGSSKESIQVKVDDGVIVFPKDGPGRQAVAQGEFAKIVLTKEQYVAQLQREAKEKGAAVDTSKITEGKTIYRINGTGAVIN
jgi:hypothetical protein